MQAKWYHLTPLTYRKCFWRIRYYDGAHGASDHSRPAAALPGSHREWRVYACRGAAGRVASAVQPDFSANGGARLPTVGIQTAALVKGQRIQAAGLTNAERRARQAFGDGGELSGKTGALGRGPQGRHRRPGRRGGGRRWVSAGLALYCRD